MWDIAGRCWRLIGNIGIAARDGLGGNMEGELGGHGVAQYFQDLKFYVHLGFRASSIRKTKVQF